MKKNLIYILSGFLTCLLFSYCIDAVDLEVDRTPPVLTIDGFLSTDPGPYVINVRNSAQFVSGPDGVPAAIFGATVKVSDDLGEEIIFVENEKGAYVSPATFRPQIGRSYALEVSLGGKTYQTAPQLLPEPIQIDQVEVEERAVETINSAGNNSGFTQVRLFLDTPLPDSEEGNYLRWRVGGQYEFPEITSSSNLIPEICYIKESIDFDNIVVASSKEVAGDFLQSEQIIARGVDYRFAYRYCFHVYQHTISEEAYDFWSAVKTEINRTGSLFETPPSPIRGNIKNPDDPNEVVLGLFSVFSADTMRYLVRPQEVSNPLPFCRPFPRPSDDCFNCLLRLNSTLEKPDYWE